MIYKPSLLISNTDNTVLWQYFDKYQIIRYVLEKEEMRRRRRKRRRRLLENVLTCGDVSWPVSLLPALQLGEGRGDVAGVALHPHSLPHLVDELHWGDEAVQGGAGVATGSLTGGGGEGPDSEVGAGGGGLPHHHVTLLTPPLHGGANIVLLAASHGQTAPGWRCWRRTEDGLTVRDQAWPPPGLITGNDSPSSQPVTEGTVKHRLAVVGVVEVENSEVMRPDLQGRTLDSLAPGVSAWPGPWHHNVIPLSPHSCYCSPSSLQMAAVSPSKL